MSIYRPMSKYMERRLKEKREALSSMKAHLDEYHLTLEAPVVRICIPRGHQRAILLEVRCPICHKIHTHGGGRYDPDHPDSWKEYLGNRAAHCYDPNLGGPQDYDLIANDETIFTEYYY